MTYQHRLDQILEIRDFRTRGYQLELLRMELWMNYKNDEARLILRGRGTITSIGGEIALNWERIRQIRLKSPLKISPLTRDSLPHGVCLQLFEQNDRFWNESGKLDED